MNGVAVVTDAGQVSIISHDQDGNLHQQNVFRISSGYTLITVNSSKTSIAATAGEDITVWTALTHNIFLLKRSNLTRCCDLQFHPSDDNILLVAYKPNKVAIWNMESSILASHRPLIECCWIRFRPSTDEIIALSTYGTIEFWQFDLHDHYEQARVVETGLSGVWNTAISADGSKIAVNCFRCTNSEEVVIIVTIDPTAVTSTVDMADNLLCRDHDVTCIEFNASSTILAVGHSNGMISLWDVASCRLRKILNGDGNRLTTMCFFDHDRYIYSGNAGRKLQVWDLEDNNMAMGDVDNIIYYGEFDKTMIIDGIINVMLPLSNAVILM